MLTDLIAIAVAVGGGGMIVLALRQAGSKGWAGSLQMMAGGLLLIGAAAIGIVGFLAGIVLNPLKWLGVVAMGLGAAMFVAGQRLEGRRRLLGRRDKGDGETSSGEPAKPKAVEGKKQDSAVAGMDEDMAEIEEILRRRGIQ
ncbi:MAG TPA: hypothetical protein VFZ37_17750 [Jiangellaceae bacterium]